MNRTDNYTILRQTYAETEDTGDPFGSAMHWWFVIADEITLRGAVVPDHWEYRPSPFGVAHEDEYEAEVVGDIDTETLVSFGNVLERYARLIKLAGLDY